jgi:hypothetical protein
LNICLGVDECARLAFKCYLNGVLCNDFHFSILSHPKPSRRTVLPSLQLTFEPRKSLPYQNSVWIHDKYVFTSLNTLYSFHLDNGSKLINEIKNLQKEFIGHRGVNLYAIICLTLFIVILEWKVIVVVFYVIDVTYLFPCSQVRYHCNYFIVSYISMY